MNKDIKSWKVIDNSLSDHNLICTETCLKNRYVNKYKDYNNTDWTIFRKTLKDLLDSDDKLKEYPLTNQNKLDNFCERLTNHIQSATDQATPTKTIYRSTTLPWWTHQLTAEKQKTKRLRKKWKKDKNNDQYHTEYKKQEKHYQTQINKEKQQSWQKFCTETEKLPRVAKLTKILKGNKSHELNTLKNDGKHTENMEETLHVLADTLLGKDSPNNQNDAHQPIIDQ